MTEEELNERLAALRGDPCARLRWRVLRAFGALPTERRVRRMTDRDFARCAMHMALDRGWAPAPGADNPAFDESRFEELRRHGMENGS